MSKVLIVKSRKEWLAGPHADEAKYRGLQIVEDDSLPSRMFQVKELEEAVGDERR